LKKHLLCTSAIIGCAMAAPATAQEWDLTWGGFMNQHIAFADVSDDTVVGDDRDGVVFHSTTEIHFTPSVTLDNGLTFGINVQMEGENNGGGAIGIDETYMSISSDTFGRIDIGSENSAGYKMMVAAPGVTSMFINSPSISTFIPLSNVLPWNFRQAGLSAYTEVAGNNDVDRLTYYSPSFNGLTVGVSYARNNLGNAVTSSNNNGGAGTVEDIFDIGVAYSQTFGSTSIDVAGRFGTGDRSTIPGVPAIVGPPPVAAIPAIAGGTMETWGIGAQVGFADFTIGGHYAENDNGFVAGFGDQSGWSIGGTYDMAGPWAFEALAFFGEYNNTGTPIGGVLTDEEYTAYRIGASRDLGPGVDWDIYAIFAEGDDKGTAGTDVSGTVLGTAINLSF